MDLSRRDFIRNTSIAAGTAAGASLSAAGAADAAARAAVPMQVAQGAPVPRGFNPADPGLKYELLIANGDVLDPSQRLRGRMDVGIRYGQIAAVAPSIPPDRAVQRFDASGKLVTPGLVDLHTHLVPHVGLGLPADELVPITATTTAVSAGDCGWHTFGVLKHLAVAQSRTRIYGFVHIASIGLAGGLAPGEMLNIDYANVDGAAKAVAENPDLVLGVKVRITDSVVGQNGLEPLRRAIRAAEQAGKWARVMCHIGAAPGNLSDLLDLLRPGDILTHSYSGAGNNTVQNGPAPSGGSRGEATGGRDRRGPRRRKLRLHGLRARHAAGLHARHDFERPRREHQHAGLSDPAVGDVQVPGARDVAGRRGGQGHRGAREDHRQGARARHAADRRPR